MRRVRLLSLAAIVLTLLAVATTGLAAEPELPPDPGSPAAMLADLDVEPEAARVGYDREAFGPAWGIRHDGCNARVVVLTEESLTPVETGTDRCDVTRGRWVSVYDGVEVVDPGALDIDHTVALAEAWDSGAAEWTHVRREAFANEVSHTDVLIAVTAGSNQSKGDQDPAEWLPPVEDAWCGYVDAWITTKWIYRLSVDRAEHEALAGVLAHCPEEAGDER